jgi:hypothetical protein
MKIYVPDKVNEGKSIVRNYLERNESLCPNGRTVK